MLVSDGKQFDNFCARVACLGEGAYLLGLCIQIPDYQVRRRALRGHSQDFSMRLLTPMDGSSVADSEALPIRQACRTNPLRGSQAPVRSTTDLDRRFAAAGSIYRRRRHENNLV